MNDVTQKMTDNHVHLDHIHGENPGRIRWLQEQGITLISWAFAMHIECMADVEGYLRTQVDTIQKLNQQGLECFFLAGIHPRNIPDDLCPEQIRALLHPFLDHPLSALASARSDLKPGVRGKEKSLPHSWTWAVNSAAWASGWGFIRPALTNWRSHRRY